MKKLIFLLVLVVAFLPLIGCGGGGDNRITSDPTEYLLSDRSQIGTVTELVVDGKSFGFGIVMVQRKNAPKTKFKVFTDPTFFHPDRHIFTHHSARLQRPVKQQSIRFPLAVGDTIAFAPLSGMKGVVWVAIPFPTEKKIAEKKRK